MRKIYFEKRCIMICGTEDQALQDPNVISFSLGESFSIDSLIHMFELSDTLMKVCIPTKDVERTYKRICDEFYEVNAAGGLVSNRRGDYLLIRRNGLWDLPKGHQESGEDIKVCAMREVEEETGIHELELRDLICITDHCYFRNGKWHLKHTWWYDMLYTNPLDLTPQREEDITQAAWIARSSIADCLTNTFPSIAEVFREAKI
ncbi:MAG: NUDIX domain-containing protein [Bacteroidales bacterium]|nr:NUDIX domain-containing protein [Bacteroidales bacterium]